MTKTITYCLYLLLMTSGKVVGQDATISYLMNRQLVIPIIANCFFCGSVKKADLENPEERIQYILMDSVLGSDQFGLASSFAIDSCQFLPKRNYRKRKIKKNVFDAVGPFLVYPIKPVGDMEGFVFIHPKSQIFRQHAIYFGHCTYIIYKQDLENDVFKVYGGCMFVN